ncbi:hypothetical protein [Cuneatibacter caecimuris]|uniref:Coat F domain-containing protein n=1 Tax=Cuneatibacter caecimuris TaxID=1796618 RepID=A0A4Q7PQW0_9FIRM|nr:hypothetical protein [Cuneatibacter caecimuris]RZT02428.1 hypothetical protein EV209_0543 [Cuneatibacter caecimuris]
MENLNEMELQTLRHLIMAHDTVSCKMESYAKEAQSPDVQQYFQKAAQTAKQSKSELMQFLN